MNVDVDVVGDAGVDVWKAKRRTLQTKKRRSNRSVAQSARNEKNEVNKCALSEIASTGRRGEEKRWGEGEWWR